MALIGRFHATGRIQLTVRLSRDHKPDAWAISAVFEVTAGEGPSRPGPKSPDVPCGCPESRVTVPRKHRRPNATAPIGNPIANLFWPRSSGDRAARLKPHMAAWG